MKPRALVIPIVASALILPALWPAAATASFHLVKVREIYPGTKSQPDVEYVELQAYASGQTFVSGQKVVFYSAGGGELAAETFGSDVANGSNQMTMVMETPAAEAQFGPADAGMATNLIDPAGGAVCWETFDCVSWGSFSGQASLPSPAGPPATPAGIPDGMALRRTIAPGCATLLEPGDDSDNSAVDFSAVFPSPRPNSVTPSEHACSGQAGGGAQAGGGGAGTGSMRPQTRIRKHPGHRTRDRTPTFRFTSDVPGSTYLCKLDRRSFKRCQSPFTARQLGFGRHVFKVKARAPGGAADRSPDTYAFTVVGRKRL